jgi:hypothetical protein
VDLPDRLPLPTFVMQTKALNASELITFSERETFFGFSQRSMIDQWELQTEYEGYFNACAPVTCTYTIDNQIDIIYILTRVIGYIGLITVLRVITPTAVWTVHEMKRVLSSRSDSHEMYSRRLQLGE